MKRLCPRGDIAQPNPQKAKHHKSAQAEKDSSNPTKSSASANPYQSKPRTPDNTPDALPRPLTPRDSILRHQHLRNRPWLQPVAPSSPESSRAAAAALAPSPTRCLRLRRTNSASASSPPPILLPNGWLLVPSHLGRWSYLRSDWIPGERYLRGPHRQVHHCWGGLRGSGSPGWLGDWAWMAGWDLWSPPRKWRYVSYFSFFFLSLPLLYVCGEWREWG